MDFTGPPGLLQGLRIQVAQHQDLAGGVVLDYSRDKTAEFLKRQFHKCLQSASKTKNPPGDLRRRAD